MNFQFYLKQTILITVSLSFLKRERVPQFVPNRYCVPTRTFLTVRNGYANKNENAGFKGTLMLNIINGPKRLQNRKYVKSRCYTKLNKIVPLYRPKRFTNLVNDSFSFQPSQLHIQLMSKQSNKFCGNLEKNFRILDRHWSKLTNQLPTRTSVYHGFYHSTSYRKLLTVYRDFFLKAQTLPRFTLN